MLTLLIPLFIHLFNRGKRKALPFGSLLWLPKQNKKLSQQIQLNQKWLWLSRSLLFALVACLIANPFFEETISVNNKHLLLIQPNVQPSLLEQIKDTLDIQQWDVQWMTYNFTPVDFKNIENPLTHQTKVNDVLKLIEEDKQKPLSVKIVGYFNAFDFGEKKSTHSFPVDWVSLPNDNQQDAFGLLQTEGSLQVLYLKEQKHLTQIEKSKFLPSKDTHLDTLILQSKTITIVYDEEQTELQKSIWASLKSLETYYDIPFKINVLKSKEYNEKFKGNDLFWLSTKLIPEPMAMSKVYVLNNNLPNETFVPISSKQIEWNASLEPQKLPNLLNNMLFYKATVAAQLTKLDNRPIHASFFNKQHSYENTSKSYHVKQQTSWMLYCWLVIMLFLLIERYLNSQ